MIRFHHEIIAPAWMGESSHMVIVSSWGGAVPSWSNLTKRVTVLEILKIFYSYLDVFIPDGR
jgi:hypothetical protein